MFPTVPSRRVTLDEYQKYFESDKALERRFQTVMVDQPDEAAAISILRGLKERYETHHRVRIQDNAIIAAVTLSNRYISDRFLPDKAIDLIDEAAAKLRLEVDSKPEELDSLDRQIKQLEIEREAVKRDGDKQKVTQAEEKLAELKKVLFFASAMMLFASCAGPAKQEKDLIADNIDFACKQIGLEIDKIEASGKILNPVTLRPDGMNISLSNLQTYCAPTTYVRSCVFP